MMPQQAAKPKQTGPQSRSALDREAKLASAPNVNNPANIHIDVLPTPGIHSPAMRPADASTKRMTAG